MRVRVVATRIGDLPELEREFRSVEDALRFGMDWLRGKGDGVTEVIKNRHREFREVILVGEDFSVSISTGDVGRFWEFEYIVDSQFPGDWEEV